MNDFLITCKTSKILDFFFNGHVIMGVARWRHIYVMDWVKDTTITKQEKLLKLYNRECL